MLPAGRFDDRGAHAASFQRAPGTAFRERRDQAERLATIVHDRRIHAPKIVLGDFNEWSGGIATAALSEKLKAIDLSVYLRRKRTYPGILPFLHLDHIYYEGHVEIAGIEIPRTRKSLIASDSFAIPGGFQDRVRVILLSHHETQRHRVTFQKTAAARWCPALADARWREVNPSFAGRGPHAAEHGRLQTDSPRFSSARRTHRTPCTCRTPRTCRTQRTCRTPRTCRTRRLHLS
jgi:hypothetical protein